PLAIYSVRDRSTLEFLLVAAGLVLLIACANIASLTLARCMGRKGELAIRMALGAGRAQVIRELLAESLILALPGGAVGVLLGYWSTAFLDKSISYLELPRMNNFRVDLRVLCFTIGVSVFAGVLFGLGPAIRWSKFKVNELLAASAGRDATTRR